MNKIAEKYFDNYNGAFERLFCNLNLANIFDDTYAVAIDCYKKERILSLSIFRKSVKKWIILKEFPLIVFTGKLGPKIEEGDRQIPEGIYEITHLNPESKFYLSARISYPNETDLMRSGEKNPGSNIYIHGGLETKGCICIGDNVMEEVFVFLNEFLARRQIHHKVFLLPFNDKETSRLVYENSLYNKFWSDLFSTRKSFLEKMPYA